MDKWRYLADAAKFFRYAERANEIGDVSFANLCLRCAYREMVKVFA